MIGKYYYIKYLVFYMHLIGRVSLNINIWYTEEKHKVGEKSGWTN